MTKSEAELICPGDIVIYVDPKTGDKDFRTVCKDLDDYDNSKAQGINSCTLKAVTSLHKDYHFYKRKGIQATSALDVNNEEYLLL